MIMPITLIEDKRDEAETTTKPEKEQGRVLYRDDREFCWSIKKEPGEITENREIRTCRGNEPEIDRVLSRERRRNVNEFETSSNSRRTKRRYQRQRVEGTRTIREERNVRNNRGTRNREDTRRVTTITE